MKTALGSLLVAAGIVVVPLACRAQSDDPKHPEVFARRYVDAGADAIFPEALVNADMFRAFARALPGVKLLANMTEFGRTPFLTAGEFEAMGYKMVIWPVSALRVANKAQARLYAALKREGGAQSLLEDMQTRAELYNLLGYHEYEALDASIVGTIVPQGMPQR